MRNWKFVILLLLSLRLSGADIVGDLVLPRTWQVFGPVSRTDPIPGSALMQSVPATLLIGDKTLPARELHVSDPFGRVDLVPLFGGNRASGAYTEKTAYVYIPLHAQETTRATLGMGADWWGKAWLDGKPVMDTGDEGNGPWPPSAGDHQCTVLLSQGEHVLVVRFVSGTGSSVLAVGGPRVLRKGKPNIPFPSRLGEPIPAGNILPNPGFEEGAVADPFIPPGWHNGSGESAFAPGECIANTQEALAGARSLELNTLSSGTRKRSLYLPLQLDIAALYRISMKIRHVAGGEVTVSVRDAPTGAETSLLYAAGGPNLRAAIAPGTSGFYSSEFFPNAYRQFLVIQTRGPTHVAIDDISLRPVDPKHRWDNYRDQRVVSDPSWYEIRRDVQTPHTPWSKPLPGAPLRVVTATPRTEQRIAVELAQRLSMSYAPLIFEDERHLGRDYWYVDEDGDPAVFRILPRALATLAEPLDCIYLQDVVAEALPDELVHAILARVSDGAGLVITGNRFGRIKLPAYQGGIWAKALTAQHRTTEDAAYLQPELRSYPQDELGMFRYGRGRIVCWTGYLAADPQRFETEMAFTLKALLWAAGRVPAARVARVEPPGNPGGSDRTQVARDGLPATVVVHLDGALPPGAFLRFWFTTAQGDTVARQERVPIATAQHSVTVPTPVLPAGLNRVNVQLLVPRDGQELPDVLDWTTRGLTVTTRVAITSLEPALAGPGYYVQGQPIRGRVTLNVAAPPGFQLAVMLRDGAGRLWAREELPVTGLHVPFTVTGEIGGRSPHVLEVALRDERGAVAVARENVSIVPPNAFYQSHYDYQIWQLPHSGSRVDSMVNQRLAGLGVTSNFFATELGTVTAAGIRSTKIACVWWVDPKRQAGSYYPGLGLRATGDIAHAPVREPCVLDPVYRDALHTYVSRGLAKTVRQAPLAYNLNHEDNMQGYDTIRGPGRDSCFHPLTQAHFRAFLKRDYGALADLNRAWRSDFADWEEVSPIVLSDAVAQHQIPRWIDHRRHMDRVWAWHLSDIMATVRELDPGAQGVVDNVRVGAAALDSYSGIDFWQLVHGVAAGSGLPAAYLNAFTPPERRHLVQRRTATWHPNVITADDDLMRRRVMRSAWINPFVGAHGFAYWTHIWASSPGKGCLQPVAPDLRYGKLATWAAPEVAQLRSGIAQFIFEGKLSDSGIAMLYSRSSEHAATAWHAVTGEAALSQLHPPERSVWFANALTQLRRTYRAISESQVVSGELADCRLLILPFSQAISPECARGIRAFVRKGGTVLADLRPAVADQHGAIGPGGLLDDVFGIHQQPPWSAFRPTHDGGAWRCLPPEPTEATRRGRAGTLVNTFGNGTAVLWNAAPTRVDEASTAPLREILDTANIPNVFGVERLAISRPDPVVRAAPPVAEGDVAEADAEGSSQAGSSDPDTMPEIGYCTNGSVQLLSVWYEARRGRGSETLRLSPQRPGHVYNLRTNEYLGRHERFTIRMPLEDVQAYAVVPYRIPQPVLSVEAAGRILQCRVALRADIDPVERHVAQFRLVGPDGEEWPDFAVTRTCQDGIATHAFHLPMDAPSGTWCVIAREAISGLETKVAAHRP